MSSDQYLNMFIDEAKEHLQHLNDNVMKLENAPDNLELVQEIFRSAHTLKGMSATMGYDDLSSLTHEMENVLDLVRNRKIQMSTFIFDVLFNSLDILEMMLSDIFEGGTGKADVTDIVSALHMIVVKNIEEAHNIEINQGTENTAAELDEHQYSVLQRSLESKQVFYIKINIDEGCLLKVARVFMVTSTLERNGEIVKITPSTDDIEQELINNELLLYFISDVDEKTLKHEILNISEINSIQIDVVDHHFLEEHFVDMQQNKTENEEKMNEPKKQKKLEKQPESHSEPEKQQVSEKQPEKHSEPEKQQVSEKQPGSHFEPEKQKQPEKHPEKQHVSQKQPEKHSQPKKEREFKKKNETENKLKPKKQRVPDKKSVKTSSNRTIRVDIDKLDTLMNLFSELLIDRVRLDVLSSEIDRIDLTETVEHMSRVSGDIQNIVLNLRMMPVESVFNRFPRMVRDLAKSLNKEVELMISGADTELDRNVIDEIGDPLVHLLRNALDHGIETPEERIKSGKSEKGILYLSAYHSGNQVFIEIEEDGRGIDKEKVTNIALKKEIISKDESQTMTEEQIHQLIFSPGFSTADKVSDISGRGVGLDVVKTKINSLGGQIHIDSKIGEGTKFSVQLPLTLSIIPAMLVRQGEEKYAIPLTSILETDILQKQDIKIVHNINMIEYREKLIPILFFKNIYDIPGSYDPAEYNIVILQKGDEKLAVVVDEFIGQQEIVLKSLGNYLTNIFAISGATILGDGQVALIVDPNALFK
ncbi:chemotaxis protein CheA [Chengkuizengella marina]|uniref:Chemotaxis protein CheA n=1 Tax=Chengkuizengella marina TaxID=2507566 RepID=A0A6N9PX37_9BACL|nr:chemotaxis protein CheA [Chengkuizengella marina]NBI27382.1 chemotaxis protein CheA [Chengkuizengella marina]